MRDVSRKLLIASAGLALAAGLTGCAGIKSALGVDKKSPDEFAIVTKAPLVVPPDFSLRPPQPGAPDTQQLTPGQAAEQTVFGIDPNQDKPTAGQSQGELALLEAAGAERADPAIRNVVASENKGAVKRDDSLTDRLMFWKGTTDKDVTLDGAAEAERIRQNEAAGKSAAENADKVATSANAEKSSKEDGGFFGHLWPF